MKLFSQKLKKRIYLDYAAATPLDPDIAKSMARGEYTLFANPSAVHRAGVEARNMIETARRTIAECLFAHSDEIIFTGSGTESDALAIIGAVHAYRGVGKPHIITSVIEHSAVLENCKMLEERGEADVTYIGITKKGIVDVKEIAGAIRDTTVLVSIMYANNEIGTIQPINEIAKAIRHSRKEKNSVLPYFHTDACQAMNYLPTENIEKLGVDLLTFNSSKIYGPKGVGVLYKKRGVVIDSLYRGGGQEFGLRSGTEHSAGISAAAHALVATNKVKEKESLRLTALREYAIEKLLALDSVSGYSIVLNGDRDNRLPNNINISISGITSELLVIELDAKGILVSAKSACKSDEPDESYVITALRHAEEIPTHTTDGSLRISLGRQTTKKEIDILVTVLTEILKKYRQWK